MRIRSLAFNLVCPTAFLFVLFGQCVGSAFSQVPSSSRKTTNEPNMSHDAKDTQFIQAKSDWSIAIHGGAGGDVDRWSDLEKQARVDGLKRALSLGKDMLSKSSAAIDVVEAVVKVLEDDPNFNAGKGSVLNSVGDVSMDASIMDGSDLSCGAVANVIAVKNPIELAKSVRDKTPHVFLCGEPADLFAKELGLKIERQEYFKTEYQIEAWKKWKEKQAAKDNKTSRYDHDQGKDRLFYLGTVGCVVRDQQGNLAAATSTGGLLGKKYGRVGDSPVIGAGTYASNATCAVSCTGVGELYIKHHIASAISARMEYLQESLEKATRHAIEKTLPEDSGGLIAVDREGNVELRYNTPMMARGEAKSDGTFRIGLKDWLK